MKYDLQQKLKDINAELLIQGRISSIEYFYMETLINKNKELFIIYLN